MNKKMHFNRDATYCLPSQLTLIQLDNTEGHSTESQSQLIQYY